MELNKIVLLPSPMGWMGSNSPMGDSLSTIKMGFYKIYHLPLTLEPECTITTTVVVSILNHGEYWCFCKSLLLEGVMVEFQEPSSNKNEKRAQYFFCCFRVIAYYLSAYTCHCL